MRLKYLTLCLLGLSLSACTQHVIKSTPASSEQLGASAANGINAILETSSYDMAGQFSLQTTQHQKMEADTPAKKQAAKSLNADQKKQIDQALKVSKVQLSQKEKNQLYDAVAMELDPYGYFLGARESSSASAGESIFAVLNDVQFSYDGSVNYRQKLAALNFNLKYLKPTLQVQAQLPFIVDFNELKLYTNYFAFMPFLVNRESQSSYAYVDLSKYKDEFNQINFKNLAVYLKQMNAVPYALAESNQLSLLPLTAQDQQQGLTRKIRYQGTLQNVFLQMGLFDVVNEPYYTEQVKGQKFSQQDAGAVQAEYAEEAPAPASEDADVETGSAEEQLEIAAYKSAARVDELVQMKAHADMYHSDEQEAEAEDVVEAEDAGEGYTAADAAAAAACAADECDAYSSSESKNGPVDAAAEAEETDQEAGGISDVACKALVNAAKVPAGYFTLCREWYGIDLFKKPAAAEGDALREGAVADAAQLSAFEQLKPLFLAAQSQQLTDAQGFKELWQKHQAEIQLALKKDQEYSIPLTIDVGLDQAGRLLSLDYAVVKQDDRFGEFRFSSTNQISNYGHAKAIDRQLMKNAKSIEEASKGSLLERLSKDLLGTLGASSSADAAVETVQKMQEQKTADELLSQIALDTYQKTDSWLKTYQAVFGLYAVVKQTELGKHYTAAELNEIAELSAYHFNEDLSKPKGAALVRLNQLADKHQLKNSDSFASMGYAVKQIVDDATEDYLEQRDWTKHIKQHKTRQAVFAVYYAERFADEYELSAEQKQQLPKAAQIVAQAFTDDLNNKLSEQSLRNLSADDTELFDQSIYRIVYRDVLTHMPK
ncbi:hypothetical protein [Acinetobacter sp. ANC 3813]|uniref:hypothetical protein n=1 Tax=Acinetobacter sp. ANC 3813 TaxID=1977873 RepID=UPI000A339DE7|nr:hypothetical protein [Acinetobacter sp. ANC 3813]OTG89635.1 hypothetical protein B9T34_10505 [Acinetobacter sp. ANC 3813]